jgi:hypothetical protein
MYYNIIPFRCERKYIHMCISKVLLVLPCPQGTVSLVFFDLCVYHVPHQCVPNSNKNPCTRCTPLCLAHSLSARNMCAHTDPVLSILPNRLLPIILSFQHFFECKSYTVSVVQLSMYSCKALRERPRHWHKFAQTKRHFPFEWMIRYC